MNHRREWPRGVPGAARTIGLFDDRRKTAICRTCGLEKEMRMQAKDCPECQKKKGKTWKG